MANIFGPKEIYNVIVNWCNDKNKTININTFCNTHILKNEGLDLPIFEYLCCSNSNDPLIYQTMELILQNGYDLNTFVNPYSSLCKNINCHNIFEKIKLFVSYGLDINTYNNDYSYDTPHNIWNTCRESNYKILNFLVNNGLIETNIELYIKKPCFDYQTFFKLFFNNLLFKQQINYQVFMNALSYAISKYDDNFLELYNDIIDNVIKSGYYNNINNNINNQIIKLIEDHCIKILDMYNYKNKLANDIFVTLNNMFIYTTDLDNITNNIKTIFGTPYCDSKLAYVKNILGKINIGAIMIQIIVTLMLKNYGYDKDHMIVLTIMDFYNIDQVCVDYGYDYYDTITNEKIRTIVLNTFYEQKDTIISDFSDDCNERLYVYIDEISIIDILFKTLDRQQICRLLTDSYIRCDEYGTSYSGRNCDCCDVGIGTGHAKLYVIGYLLAKNNIDYGELFFDDNANYRGIFDYRYHETYKYYKYHKYLAKFCNQYVFPNEMYPYYNNMLITILWAIKYNLINGAIKQVLKYIIIPFVFIL